MKHLNIDGKKLMCTKHGIDYRIACDECQEKHSNFSKITLDIVKMNEACDCGGSKMDESDFCKDCI